jgi:hypothetical protein
MVPTTGLAPVWPFGHSALDAARLLLRHAGKWYLASDSNREEDGFEPFAFAVSPARYGTRRGIRTRHCAGFKSAASAVGLRA